MRALFALFVAGALFAPAAHAYTAVGKIKVSRQLTSADLVIDLVELEDGSKCVITRDPRVGSPVMSCNVTSAPLK